MTVNEAQQHLDAWLKADLAVSTGQSYIIDGQDVTRVDADKIRENIIYWTNKVRALKRGKGFKIYNGIPR